MNPSCTEAKIPECLDDKDIREMLYYFLQSVAANAYAMKKSKSLNKTINSLLKLEEYSSLVPDDELRSLQTYLHTAPRDILYFVDFSDCTIDYVELDEGEFEFSFLRYSARKRSVLAHMSWSREGELPWRSPQPYDIMLLGTEKEVLQFFGLLKNPYPPIVRTKDGEETFYREDWDWFTTTYSRVVQQTHRKHLFPAVISAMSSTWCLSKKSKCNAMCINQLHSRHILSDYRTVLSLARELALHPEKMTSKLT